ncbi:MAG TPA: hypothetical protein VE954_30520 [Oligoflexus sp.]|uniref:hypothetical protein n=1 Tax=Oligoflexus sp. TaxID=1971216 RepID=UPI002D45AC6C|nr:hypothetical protein [Oligoflexus sp.]HYX37459.1 hypothetical protein [Oligoflexus sp.]
MKSLLWFCGFLLIAGCHRLNNSVQDLAVECALPSSATGRYIKILNDSGLSFYGEGAKRLQARFVSEQGLIKTLAVTNGGCIEVPQELGSITVVEAQSKQSLTIALDPSYFSSSSVIKKNLQTLSDFSLSLNCPPEGHYADEWLQSPESLAFAGDVHGLEYRLDLYTTNNQFLRTMFDKRLGSGSLNSQAKVPVADLPEGAYSIRLYGRHVANGIDAMPALLNSEKSCPLYILHGDVKLSGAINAHPIVVAKGKTLDWKPARFGEQLLVCREERNSCVPKACKDSGVFQRVDEVIASENGVYDYHVYASDKLGRKSPPSCQTIIVTDSRPDLSLEWKAQDLKVPGSVLRVPYAVIEASIGASHDLVDKDILNKNLQCKVSFEILGRDQLAGNSVICTKGQCKGKGMGEFVPCDPELGFSIVQAWEQPLVSNSRLRLIVRSSDSAGHEAEAEISFWINKSTWETKKLDFQENGENWSVQGHSVTQSGIPLVNFSNDTGSSRTARYVNDAWEVWSEFNDASYFKFHKAPDGALSAYTVYRSPDQQVRSEYLQFDESGRIEKRTDLKNGYEYHCGFFNIDKKGRLWCSGHNEFAYFADGSWHKLSKFSEVLQPGDDPGSTEYPWLVDQNSRLWRMGRKVFFIHEDASGWRRLDLSHDLKNLEFGDVVEDSKGQIWVTSYDPSNFLTQKLYRLENNHLQEFKSPEPLAGYFYYPTFETKIMSLKQIQIGFQVFNFETETWTVLENGIVLPEELGMADNKVTEMGRGILSLPNHGFFEVQKELVYWPTKNLGFNCSCVPSDHESGQDFFFLVKDQNGLDQLTRLKTHKSSLFDGSMWSFYGSYAVDSWLDGQGHANFAMANNSILQMTPEGVRKLPVRLPATAFRVTPLSGGRYCVWGSNTISVVDPNSNVQKIYEGPQYDSPTYCREDSRGRFWFATSKSVGFADDQRIFHPKFESTSQATGLMTTLVMLDQGQTLWISYEKLIRIVAIETDEVKDIWFDQLFSGAQIAEVYQPGQISENEFSIHSIDVNGIHKNYIYDLKTGLLTEDTSLSQLDLNYAAIGTRFRGDKAWAYAYGSDKKFALLTRTNKVWSKVSDDVSRPWVDVRGPAIQWVPDLVGRIWFMSSYPNYEFYRYDP